MDYRSMIRQHLTLAREHVAQGEKHVARQREIVAELDRDGHDAALARQLLEQFERVQANHVADRDRLEKELGEEGPA